ncbi:MAG: hypothetical protein ABW190_15600 [Rhizobacter sp.]
MLLGQEIPLFWAMVCGLLFIDNCVLLPAGGDCLRFGRAGRLRYELGLRIEVLRRDMVVLNPFNPFDRAVVTTRSIGAVGVPEFRSAVKQVQASRAGANALSWLGCVYLVVLAVLAAASGAVYFGFVLAVFAVMHLVFWGVALTLLVRRRATLGLSGSRVLSLAIEALFVPGYLVNLGKRVWFKRSFELPAVTLGLRQLGRLRDEGSHELQRGRLSRRLDEIGHSLDVGSPTHQWFLEAQQCLTASTPPAGS